MLLLLAGPLLPLPWAEDGRSGSFFAIARTGSRKDLACGDLKEFVSNSLDKGHYKEGNFAARDLEDILGCGLEVPFQNFLLFAESLLFPNPLSALE